MEEVVVYDRADPNPAFLLPLVRQDRAVAAEEERPASLRHQQERAAAEGVVAVARTQFPR